MGACGGVSSSSGDLCGDRYASPLSATETQLEIEGHVTGAPGPLGAAEGEVNRAAEVSIHALLAEVIERLRRDIDSQTDSCAAT